MKKILFVGLFLMMVAYTAWGAENVGYETNGGAQFSTAPGYTWAYKLLDTPSSDGVLDSITFTLDGNGLPRYFKFALYTNASGMPGTLVANSVTVEGSVTSSDATDVTLAVASGTCSITSGTTYWIVQSLKDGGSTVDAYYDGSIGGADTSYKTMPYDTWSSWGGTEDGNLALRAGKGYFTYHTAESGGTVATGEVSIW